MRTALAACWISACVALGPSRARAQEFFVTPELDFWGEGGAGRAPARPAAAGGEGRHPVRKIDERPFRWEDYADPSNEAFWDDGGDYIPPRPLRVAAANPTPENIANLLRWQRRKLEAISQVQAEVARQMATDPDATAPAPDPIAGFVRPTSGAPTAAAVGGAAAEGGGGVAPIEWAQVSLVLFYSASCPHCRASVATVQELERRGATVIPVQVDWEENAPLFPGSAHYTAELAEVQPVDSVPTWVASYAGNKATMQGRVTVESIEKTLKLSQVQAQLNQQ